VNWFVVCGIACAFTATIFACLGAGVAGVCFMGIAAQCAYYAGRLAEREAGKR
jgi:hypothetical protein